MTPDDHATIAALIAGVDATAREHEQMWGIDRLHLLVDDELRAKFFRQKSRWSAAIEAAYETEERRPLTVDQLETIQALSDGLKRGWAAMAVQASEKGYRAIVADVWEMRLADGSKAALVRSVAECGAIEPNRYVSVWTLDEIVNVIGANLSSALIEAKTVWPAAKLQLRVSGAPWNAEGDEIPFGVSPIEDATLAFEKPGAQVEVIEPKGRVSVADDF